MIRPRSVGGSRTRRRCADEHLRAQAERYPTLAAHLDMLDGDWEDSFRRGLDYLIDGIAARLG